MESFSSTLCLNARKAVVDKQMGCDPSLPGPGQYVNPLTEGRNSNGEVKAVLSHQVSTPSVCFSLDGRKEKGRPIELNADTKMGPTYNLDNVTSGRQVQSRLRTAPSATFGGGGAPSARPRSAPISATRNEPSPQHYDTQNLTKVRLSTQRSVTGLKFSTGPRTYNDQNAREARSLPAPGQYKAQSAIGTQVESKYRGGYQFTIAGRRREASYGERATSEPGPGHYVDPVKEGRNAQGEVKAVLSNQRSCPSAVFTRATYTTPRPKSAAARTAGPCYHIPSAIGKQTNSRYRSQPSISFGAR